MRTVGISLLLFFIVSCFPKKHKITYHQNMESVFGWMDEPTLESGQAYSGYFFSRTDSTRPYGVTFTQKLKNISNKAIKRIDAGVWVRMPDTSAKAQWVVSIEKVGTSLFWAGVEPRTVDPLPDKWTRLYVTYDLPEEYDPEALVKIYLWNESKKIVDIDDIDVHFYLKE